MSKFREGDRIVRISQPHSWVPIGYSCEVMSGDNYINANGDYKTIHEKAWQLEKRHVHHDLIIAWAKGATIGYTNYTGNKIGPIFSSTPTWSALTEYHIHNPQTDAELISALRARIDELEGEYGT